MNKQLSDESIWTEDNPHTIVDVGPFYLLILNTALTACSNADNKRLMIGSVFIDACVSRVNDGKPIIAMGHHGFDWLRDEENHVCTKFWIIIIFHCTFVDIRMNIGFRHLVKKENK